VGISYHLPHHEILGLYFGHMGTISEAWAWSWYRRMRQMTHF